MTVLEDLRGLEGRVATRMNELRPLVDEYRELEQVAHRLGLKAGDDATPTNANESSRTRARGATRSARGSSRATGAAASTSRAARKPRRQSAARRSASNTGAAGARQQQVAELVKGNPGITVRELGSQLGVDPTSLYRVVHRLEQAGTIKKNGRELRPA
ncbi:MAG: hypothetical protein V7607_2594 [Solirubrobacteraceae bacterium]